MTMRFILFLLSPLLFEAQTWIQLPDFPGTKRDDGIGITVNDKAFFGSGLQEGWTPTRDFFAFDINTFSWQSIAPMPEGTERQYACAFAGKNCFFVFGGISGNSPLNDLYKYDLISDSWSKMSSRPGTGCVGATCLAFGDTIVFVGGKISENGPVIKEVWSYSIKNDIWTQKTEFPFAATWRAAGAAIHTTGYLLFGFDGNKQYTNALYRYNVVNDKWTAQTTSFIPQGRAYCALRATPKGLVFFAGHSEGNVYHNDLWYFNQSTEEWSVRQQFPSTPRRGDMAAFVRDKFIFTCGLAEGDVRLKETWMMDVPLRTDKHINDLSVQIFPSPANDILTIRTEVSSEYHITILNEKGECIETKSFLGKNETLDVSRLSEGLYFVEIKSDDQRSYKKFVKR